MLLFSACANKTPNKSLSSTILFKTPTMKYYDKGFINYFDDYIHLQLLNVGTVVLDLSIYQDKVCQGTFKCLSSNEFNKRFLNATYKDDFLYKLFMLKKVNFKDRKNNILIKVK